MKFPVVYLGSRARQRRMQAKIAAIAATAGMSLAAGAMLLLDPDRGAARRTLLRDQIVSRSRKLVHRLDKMARDLRNRTHKLPAVGGAPVFGSGASPRGGGPQIVQSHWSPADRLLAGTVGAGLFFAALASGGAAGVLAGAAGAGLVTRALSNVRLSRLLGLRGRRGVDIRKTMIIDAPIEGVYAFWADLENIPRIMSHVREVRQIGPGRFQWKVDGPGGVPVEWTAVVTKLVPQRILCWKSEEGSVIRQAGAVRFDAQSKESTMLDLRLSYNLPLGAVGHTVASLLGVDPKSMIDDDLVRFKSLMEEGKTRAHDRLVKIEDLWPPAPISSGHNGQPPSGRQTR